MNVEVFPALPEQQPILADLLELYIHDFTEILKLKAGPDGRFGYPSLPLYWSEAGRHPLLVGMNGEFIGFALVKKGSEISGDPSIWDMAEFFIVRGYRNRGIGTQVAHQVWRRFPGLWEVRVMQANQPARMFWQRALKKYIGQPMPSMNVEKGGKLWSIFSFESGFADLPLIARAQQHGQRTSVVDTQGAWTYEDLLQTSAQIASALLAGHEDLQEQRVAFLLTPGYSWVATQWGIWRAGGIAVPLPLNAPPPELEYLIDDTAASILIFDTTAATCIEPIVASSGLRVIPYVHLPGSPTVQLPQITPERRAMILYTSGTTSRPKGVVTTHKNIAAQINTLVEAWEWSQGDRILLCLPLHHVHGIINVVSCALWSGATCDMLSRFDAATVWDRIAAGGLTLFMAVPTIYAKLIAAWEAASPERRAQLTEACSRLRLMVSGSAALPVSTLERWKEITGHTLLERYGMTEIGMALSNPLHGRRVPGTVGTPLPGVQVQLADTGGKPAAPGTPGGIEVRGPAVFLEYWAKPEATRESFRDGWFLTGDTAVVENGLYRILGRTNIDILKTGGHKLSALEIEETLRQHPAIAECAVVGVPDPEWGERVAAALVLRPGQTLDLPSLRAWGREHLAPYKLPSRLLILEALPRNAMGKVTKPVLPPLFQTQD
jgi:malonyl-CoA/methylmalonyl-CoA synthetase